MQTRAGAANLEASRLHALCSLLLQFRSTHLTNTYPVHAAGLARGQAPREMPLCCSLPHPPPCLCGLLLHPFWKLLQRPLRPQPLRFYTLLPCLHRTPNVCDDSAGGHAAMPHDVGIARRKRLLGARGWAGAGGRGEFPVTRARGSQRAAAITVIPQSRLPPPHTGLGL